MASTNAKVARLLETARSLPELEQRKVKKLFLYKSVVVALRNTQRILHEAVKAK
jgi:hypothetical protein